MNNSKFTWGEYVLIKQLPANESLIGVSAVICGISKVETEHMSKLHGLPIGGFLYTVEIDNGESYLLPEDFLEKEL